MRPKNYKIKLPIHASRALAEILEKVIVEERQADTATKIMLSGMAEVLWTLRKKLLDQQPTTKLQLSTTQALAMQCLYEYYIEPVGCHTGYLESHLRRVANEVHQQYFN